MAIRTPPGSSHLYTNPHDPAYHVVSLGDWVQGKPGLSNASAVRNALDTLKGQIIVVPIWDVAGGSGATTTYHIVGFATVQLLDYHLPGQDRVSVQFLGYGSCAE